MHIDKAIVRVFVGSPNDVVMEREFLKKIILKFNDQLLFHRIKFEVFDYRDLYPTLGDPQDTINRYIKASDLVILLFGFSLGAGGTVGEFQLAKRMYNENILQNLMLYFKKENNASNDGLQDAQKEIISFKKEIEKTVLYQEFEDSVELESKVKSHLSQWLIQLDDLFNVFDQYQYKISEEIIETLKVREAPYDDEIIDLKKTCDEKKMRKMGEKALSLYTSTNHPFHYQLGLKNFYLIANYLFTSILNNEFSVCRHKPFIHPIHQYLSKMIRVAGKDHRIRLISNLTDWLVAKEKVYSISRDFAAFELGMSKGVEATDALLTVLADSNEIFAVRNYSAMAIGMFRDRKNSNALMKVFKNEHNTEINRTLAHSILFINNLIS